MKSWSGSAALAAVTVFCGLAAAAPAFADDGFYAGKRIAFAIGFSAGGGHDTYARMLARHYGRHVPGNPSVVVQNMPGAASSKAVVYLDAGAPRDGTVIASFGPDIIPLSLTSPDKIKVNFSKVAWIGSIAQDERLCFAWHGAPFKAYKDLFNSGRSFNVGASSAGSNAYNSAAILRNVFKANVKTIGGYPGSAEQRIAIERGELDGGCGSWASIPRDWVREKKIVPLVAFSNARAEGMENIPYVLDLAKSEKDKKVLKLLLAASEQSRPYVASLGVPKERIATLRMAFDATMKDRVFLDEAAKGRRPVSPITGAEAERNIAEIYAAGPDIVAAARDVIK